MKRASRKVIDAAARLAVFAMSSHEELVRRGAHERVMPPMIDDMARACGVEPAFLLARGYHLCGMPSARAFNPGSAMPAAWREDFNDAVRGVTTKREL